MGYCLCVVDFCCVSWIFDEDLGLDLRIFEGDGFVFVNNR